MNSANYTTSKKNKLDQRRGQIDDYVEGPDMFEKEQQVFREVRGWLRQAICFSFSFSSR